ncbi:hypothetical protein MLD38_009307 [Melastoma candidum]|uniref:Uncharacterized protein n=1 Tax=Melastoma candidum TaxID=119954 RepID=A0ACB9RWT3_9MYRT|nr:hypothetical protein MLD38_009307 [Melastoma candidum]
MSSSVVRNHSNNHDDSPTASLPAPILPLPSHTLLRAAVSLKDQVVRATFGRMGSVTQLTDPTAYTGLLGTAIACLRSFRATGDRGDLLMASEIVDACAASSGGASARRWHHVTFLCGRGGVYGLGAVVADILGDPLKRDSYLNLFLQLAHERALPVGPEDGGFGMSYDLLYGRAGFLWAALFINHHLGPETVPNNLLMPIVDAVIAGGRAGASDIASCPLMYRWHGTRYLGAANGLAGILQVLLHFPLSEEYAEDVKGTLRYMMSNRFPHSGNYPSSEGNPRDKLVQWSHGATGMAMTLCKASQVFPSDREFRDAAIEAGEVVWKNGLMKKVGLADGASGNAYAFLSLFRLTGEILYEERAKAFASFLYHNATELMTTTAASNNAWSLYYGLAGTACLWFDVTGPELSSFPGYEL